MKVVALISGGKDSLFNMLQCIAAGHEIAAVANIEPETKEELDSYMYQSVGHQVVSLIAVALGLPIYRQKTKGKAVCKFKTYIETTEDEVEDMLQLLVKVKRDIPLVEGVSVGAIASDYQRTRVESVCSRLGLKSFAYLWRRNQAELLQEMIDADLDAIIIKVASIGLDPETHLGMHIRDLKPHLMEISAKYGVNVCGEGGEYETLTTDCPLFHRKINIIDSENLVLSNDAFAPVAFLNVKNAVLKPKFWGTDDPVLSLQTRLAYVKAVVKDPYKYVEDCVDEVSSNIFPQNPVSSSNILPFPFDPQEDSNDSKSMTNMGEYWKKGSSASHMQPSQRIPFLSPSMSMMDTTVCNLNYSTGWCCIGNVTGISIKEAMMCLERHLERTKYEMKDIVFINMFIRDMADYPSINKVYCQHVPDLSPPARACVATVLPGDINVLLIAVAHKSVSKSQKVISSNCTPVKDVMHVQSISHWAPANIGPYSQCVRIGELYYLAGQIPLIPGSMELLNKPIVHQCKLTLRHISRVLEVMNESLSMANVMQAICYVSSEEIISDLSNLWSYVTKNDTATVAVVAVLGLPKFAQMEWEVFAIGFDGIQVQKAVDFIDEFSVSIRRCFNNDPYASSFVCRVTLGKKLDGLRNPKELTSDTLKSIIRHCLAFIRKDVKHPGLHLCMLKLFYKHNYYKLGDNVCEMMRSFDFEHKVVASGIPVISCGKSDVILTIAGICH